MSKPLLEAKDISMKYGTQAVLSNISFQVAEGQKIALIGRNGAGKSTLLKILTGEIEKDSGSVVFFDWTRVGVIRQNEVLPNDTTTLSFLEDLSGKPSWEVKKMCSKFGLHDAYLEKTPSELSGGYQMRVKLIGMFLMDPNLLFLDEPVNYLDLQTLLLLENVLSGYRGSFILVAHDRTFLQNTCETTFEIERAQLTTYKGKVQEYLEWKAEQLEFAKRSNKKFAREISHHQKFVDRFRYKASLATRAQNKIKHISKLRTKILKINADLATTRISIPFPAKVHGGPALHVNELSIGYGKLVLAKNIHFDINRGDKVVIVGENGRGKSTLLKTLVNKIEPISGTVKWWKHADVGYYDQLTSSSLNEKDTVISHLTKSAPAGISAEKILMMAGNFLFQGNDLDKKIAVLSGGERARLALAGILLHEHNVLILDEPTNHLDVETTEGLALALSEYTGTVVFVSHARTFVGALANKILEVRHGSIREYMADYPAYVDYLAALAEEETLVAGDETKEESKQVQDKFERKERLLQIREMQRMQKRIEKEIKALEVEKSEIMKYFFENPTDYAPPKAMRLDEIKQVIEKQEEAWIKLEEKVHELRT